MKKFTGVLNAWQTAQFKQTLKKTIESLQPGCLPLAGGTTQGGFVNDQNISATILGSCESETDIETRVGIFFTEVVANCSCGDEPMELNAYCEIKVNIDKETALPRFSPA